ncbi:unnamed protein product [Thelazia callipaeda]|uniref:Uncharacterized protein n=1 Tax=Thelazia callipaeda TaxID=103827 RepID=A0A0N5CMS7_THECL|nr:unnamed protein product [Thelazia callipaeda]
MLRTSLTNRQLTISCFLLFCIISAACNSLQPALGTKCLQNQVVTKVTVFEDGAIEAECTKLPCGSSGTHCKENQTSCKAETDTFSGMKWASNGQSILQRCCTLSVSRKIYVGTDLVSLGSYYIGGKVDKKDFYGKEGTEFDFVSNIRTEQYDLFYYYFECSKQKISFNPLLFKNIT